MCSDKRNTPSNPDMDAEFMKKSESASAQAQVMVEKKVRYITINPEFCVLHPPLKKDKAKIGPKNT